MNRSPDSALDIPGDLPAGEEGTWETPAGPFSGRRASRTPQHRNVGGDRSPDRTARGDRRTTPRFDATEPGGLPRLGDDAYRRPTEPALRTPGSSPSDDAFARGDTDENFAQIVSALDMLDVESLTGGFPAPAPAAPPAPAETEPTQVLPPARPAQGFFADPAAWQEAAPPRPRTPRPPRHARTAPGQAAPPPRTSWREDMMSALLSLILTLGLFLDGWNHLNLPGDPLGAFLTPWHFLLYAGFVATALWEVTRNQRLDGWSAKAVPPGYDVALKGIVLGVVALLGGGVWGAVVGEGEGLARILSPFHMLLILASCLLASAGFRASWRSPELRRRVTLRQFAPALASTLAVTALVAFFVQFLNPLVAFLRPAAEAGADDPALREVFAIYGVVAVLVTTVLYLAPVLLILRRWHPPFGSITLLFGGLAVLTAGLTNLSQGVAALATLMAGGFADLVIQRLRPRPEHPSDCHRVAAIVPLVWWALYFGLFTLFAPAGAGGAVSLGTIGLASLAGFTLSVVMNAPALPVASVGRMRGCRGSTTGATSLRHLGEG